MTLDKAWADAEKRDVQRQARSEWRDVEDAVDAIESPVLQLFKAQLLDVLRTNYKVLNEEDRRGEE